MTNKAYYHLPGLFEFYDLYAAFLPIFREHREYFYDWCEIGSVYGAPADCIWGGGRAGFGEHSPREVLDLMKEYNISSRLTFSNSLLREEHLSDKKVQRPLQAVFPKPASTKWCDNMLRPASFISERELSPPLFCVLYHKSPHRVFSACKRA